MPTLIPRPLIAPAELDHFLKFACPPTEPFTPPNTPFTPDRVNPNRVFIRRLTEDFALILPGGRTAPNTGVNAIPMWVISDRAPNPPIVTFPSPLIRVVKGEIVHTVTSTRQGTHTIHHHGIEPTPCNDGVGKMSFEIGGDAGQYTYQWFAAHPGTYFYHCHKNTVLHVEMGLYGGLIIDPPRGSRTDVPAPPYPFGGPGLVEGFNPGGGNVIRYDTERFWVVDEIDSQWHVVVAEDHDAFMAMCPHEPTDPPLDPNDPNTFTQDGNLNNFRPDVFVITGVPVAVGSTPITPSPTSIEIPARVNQTTLLRLLHAGYTIQQYTFGLDALVIGMDGRALGVPPYQNYSRPFVVPAGRSFRFTSAMRWDIIFRPTTTGRFPVTVEFFDWVTGRRYVKVESAIVVAP